MKDNSILNGFRYAEEKYSEAGVDINAAVAKADGVPISMHCWQGDDVIGFDGIGALTGGIATTGNYPGRARTAGELRDDIAKALTMIPGRTKLNLHACYAEKKGKNVDRDAYTPHLFDAWVSFAKDKGLGLDFNPTFFSHPMMDGDFSLSSPKPEVRRFWIEHGKRCREIGLSFAKDLALPCVVNYWMPDGYKNACADTCAPRKRMIESLDEIFRDSIDETLVPCAVESKLFGVGLESYTVASHEFSMGYAIKNNKVYCLDSGHFHPTETVSAKITSVLCFVDKVLLHVSRGVRWDSDHVILWDDELQNIMNEIVWNDVTDRVYIGLDYFDASVNRIAAWVIGMRNARKALLWACLTPYEAIRKLEREGDLTGRLALMENVRTLPFGAVWDDYCVKQGIPTDKEWLQIVRSYEREVLFKR